VSGEAGAAAHTVPRRSLSRQSRSTEQRESVNSAPQVLTVSTPAFGATGNVPHTAAATNAPHGEDTLEVQLLKAKLALLQLQAQNAPSEIQHSPVPLPAPQASEEVVVDVEGEAVVTEVSEEDSAAVYYYNMSYGFVCAALMLWIFINPQWIILIAYTVSGFRVLYSRYANEEWANNIFEQVLANPRYFACVCGFSLLVSFVLCQFSFLLIIGLALTGIYTAKTMGLNTSNVHERLATHISTASSTPRHFVNRIKGLFTRQSTAAYGAVDQTEIPNCANHLTQSRRFVDVSDTPQQERSSVVTPTTRGSPFDNAQILREGKR